MEMRVLIRQQIQSLFDINVPWLRFLPVAFKNRVQTLDNVLQGFFLAVKGTRCELKILPLTLTLSVSDIGTVYVQRAVLLRLQRHDYVTKIHVLRIIREMRHATGNADEEHVFHVVERA